MKKYRPKLATFIAVRWYPPEDPRHEPWPGVEKGPRGDQAYVVFSGSRWREVLPGDWIVGGEDGSVTIMPDVIFRERFEEGGS